MTELLEKAFAAASKLPKEDQDALASWILEELSSEQNWEVSFTNSKHKLAQLADEALAEHREGRSQLLDPERL